ncbi:MAG: alpha/beta hydrolase-fold protein [Sphingomonas bacterium]
MGSAIVTRAVVTSLALLTWLALLAPPPAAAQTLLLDPQPISIGETLTLHSALLKEDRRVLIHLPQGYASGSQRYPVLYLLDGDDHFLHVSGIVDYLAARGRMPAVILVGIANTNRTRDLTPAAKNIHAITPMLAFQATVDVELTGAGGANAFLGFLKTELAPAIEAKYRTTPFRILAGHSLGGLFVAHVLTTDADAFDAYLAASPSLWWDDEALIKRAAKAMPPLGVRQHWLYMSTGEEGAGMLGSLGDFKSVLTLANPPHLDWTARVLPGETHATTPHRVFYDGLEWLFRDYALDEDILAASDLGRIERHLAEASRIYGYDLAASETMINGIGYNQIQMFKRPDKAVSIFRRNAALHPLSPNAYDSLADGLEADGKDVEALQNRDKAVALATEQKDANRDAYAQARDRLRAKLAGMAGK